MRETSISDHWVTIELKRGKRREASKLSISDARIQIGWKTQHKARPAHSKAFTGLCQLQQSGKVHVFWKLFKEHIIQQQRLPLCRHSITSTHKWQWRSQHGGRDQWRASIVMQHEGDSNVQCLVKLIWSFIHFICWWWDEGNSLNALCLPSSSKARYDGECAQVIWTSDTQSMKRETDWEDKEHRSTHTCQRFAVIWPRFVQCFPSYLCPLITDAQLACFSSLTSLDLTGRKWVDGGAREKVCSGWRRQKQTKARSVW